MKDSRLRAATKDSGRTFHNYDDGSSRQNNPIDYIMANEQYLRSVSSYRIIKDKYDGKYPSDHFAIVAKLTLANK